MWNSIAVFFMLKSVHLLVLLVEKILVGENGAVDVGTWGEKKDF